MKTNYSTIFLGVVMILLFAMCSEDPAIEEIQDAPYETIDPNDQVSPNTLCCKGNMNGLEPAICTYFPGDCAAGWYEPNCGERHLQCDEIAGGVLFNCSCTNVKY